MTQSLESRERAQETVAMEPEALVAATFPEKEGLRRRIAHLWGKYYRVNYFNPEEHNYIVESHFIQVRGDKVIESN